MSTDLFEAQVERTPDAVAIVFEGEAFTYRELNARANQLAHYLIKRGVGPDVLVGICVERSLEMVVGLLGILKAGGAYVPLDAEYPRERLEFMVRDTGIRILLTQRRLTESIPRGVEELFCLDTDWNKIAGGKRSESGRWGWSRKPCVCHVHLRIDRDAQRSGGSAPGHCASGDEYGLREVP